MDNKRQHNTPLKSKPTSGAHSISLYDTGSGMQSGLSSSFTESNVLTFIYKKAEKHAAVSYMLTNFLSDNEPLKWKLRGNSISFLSLINKLRSSSNNGAQRLLEVVSKINELESLYQIMRLGGHISEMNLTLVTKELTSLKDLLENNITQKSPVAEIAIDQAIFNEELPERATDRPSTTVDIKDNNLYKGHTVSQDGEVGGLDIRKVRPVAKKSVSQIKTRTGSPERARPQPAYRQPARNALAGAGRRTHKEARRESIKQTLKNRGELTIKDIATAINGCSEKTVQRELNALIKDNIVKRIGERRWSKYSLV